MCHRSSAIPHTVPGIRVALPRYALSRPAPPSILTFARLRPRLKGRITAQLTVHLRPAEPLLHTPSERPLFRFTGPLRVLSDSHARSTTPETSCVAASRSLRSPGTRKVPVGGVAAPPSARHFACLSRSPGTCGLLRTRRSEPPNLQRSVPAGPLQVVGDLYGPSTRPGAWRSARAPRVCRRGRIRLACRPSGRRRCHFACAAEGSGFSSPSHASWWRSVDRPRVHGVEGRAARRSRFTHLRDRQRVVMVGRTGLEPVTSTL